MDCLLANWDVIGTAGGDNIRLGEDGKVYRLDNGGALRFRARGEKKGTDFNEEVAELDTMRRRNELFADISDEEILKQIDEILKNKDKILAVINSAAVDSGAAEEAAGELKPIIAKRFDYLQNFLESEKLKPEENKNDKGIYESIATNNYFNGWERLGLQGNKNIKEKIRENIISAEKKNQERYKRAAVTAGISVEEFKQKFQEKIEDMVRRSNFLPPRYFSSSSWLALLISWK